MEATPARPSQGKKLDVSCPPPEEWVHDERGRPNWIPIRRSGTWHRLIDRRLLTIELPRLADKQDNHHGYGRPRLVDSQPDLDELVWRHDLLGDGYRKIAADLNYQGKDPRTKARYRVEAGRKSLAAKGVIPWAAYPNGSLPAQWWTDEALEDVLHRWTLETLQPTPITALIRSTNQPTRRFLTSLRASSRLTA